MDYKRIFHPKVFLLILFCLNVLAYHNAIHNDFRYDQPIVYHGAEIPRFIDRVKYAFLIRDHGEPVIQPDLAWFRPIPFLISWQLLRSSQGNPYVINIANILIVTLVGYILFRFLVFLTHRRFLAAVAAVIFCLHPVNGIWINDYQGGVHQLILLGLKLLSMHAFLYYLIEKKGAGMYWLSLFLFILALLFHEVAIFFPLYLALTVRFFVPDNAGKGYLLLVPYGIIIGIFLWIRKKLMGGDSFLTEGLGYLWPNIVSYVATVVKTFVLYLGKLVSLDGIVISWSEPFLKTNFWPWLLLGMVLLFVLAVACIVFRRNVVAWAVGLMITGFLPIAVGGLLLHEQGLMYEANWIFFTSVGYFVFVGWLVDLCCRKWRRIGMALFVFLTAVWLQVTWGYNNLYADEVRYAQYYKQCAPGFRMADIFLFEAYFKRKEYGLAQRALLEARAGNRDDFSIYYFVALLDFYKGDYSQAEKNIFQSLQMEQGFKDGYLLLGQIFLKQGRADLAEKAFMKAQGLGSSVGNAL